MTLETGRLLLRPMEGSDLDAMLAMFTDPAVMKAFSLESFSRDDMQRWIGRNLAHQEQHGYGLFTVVLKANGAVIGDCGLEHTDFQGRACVELGYDLLSAHWNRGYATEAATRVRDFALQELGIHRAALCSFIRKTNAASRRVSEKIGMRGILEFQRHGTGYFLYGFDAEPAARDEGSAAALPQSRLYDADARMADPRMEGNLEESWRSPAASPRAVFWAIKAV